MVFTKLFSAVCFCLLGSRVSAWGKDGHGIIADIAQLLLNEKAHDAVLHILSVEGKGTNMSDVSSWADLMTHTREFKWSAPLHFANIRDPNCGTPETGYNNCTFVYKRDCVDRDGNNPGFCNAGAVLNYTQRLKEGLQNPEPDTNKTLNALKFLIHFVGDISQPLHCGMLADRGGVVIDVDYYVNGQGSRWNLHNVWDFGMIVNKEGIEGDRLPLRNEILEQLEGKWGSNMKQWASVTDPKKWVQDSLDEATLHAYRFANGTQVPKEHYHVDIPESYYDAYMCKGCLVELQLAKGGVRLAQLLNSMPWN